MRKWISLLESAGIPVDTTLYHGSHAEFSQFEPGHSNGWSKPRSGFYFTDDQEVVEEFFGKAKAYRVRLNNAATFEYGQGGDIIRKIASLDPEVHKHLEEIIEDRGHDHRLADAFASKGYLQTDNFIKCLQSLGYDGMVFDDLMSRTPFTSYVAFSPDSISAQ